METYSTTQCLTYLPLGGATSSSIASLTFTTPPAGSVNIITYPNAEYCASASFVSGVQQHYNFSSMITVNSMEQCFGSFDGSAMQSYQYLCLGAYVFTYLYHILQTEAMKCVEFSNTSLLTCVLIFNLRSRNPCCVGICFQ